MKVFILFGLLLALVQSQTPVPKWQSCWNTTCKVYNTYKPARRLQQMVPKWAQVSIDVCPDRCWDRCMCDFKNQPKSSRRLQSPLTPQQICHKKCGGNSGFKPNWNNKSTKRRTQAKVPEWRVVNCPKLNFDACYSDNLAKRVCQENCWDKCMCAAGPIDERDERKLLETEDKCHNKCGGNSGFNPDWNPYRNLGVSKRRMQGTVWKYRNYDCKKLNSHMCSNENLVTKLVSGAENGKGRRLYMERMTVENLAEHYDCPHANYKPGPTADMQPGATCQLDCVCPST